MLGVMLYFLIPWSLSQIFGTALVYGRGTDFDLLWPFYVAINIMGIGLIGIMQFLFQGKTEWFWQIIKIAFVIVAWLAIPMIIFAVLDRKCWRRR